jgi:hypothetical protein
VHSETRMNNGIQTVPRQDVLFAFVFVFVFYKFVRLFSTLRPHLDPLWIIKN